MTAPAVNVRGLPLLTRQDAFLVAGCYQDLAVQIGVPYETWGGRCHEVSLALLRTGSFGRGRIARGTCYRVPAQHSWIVLGDDCYDPDTIIVDPTLHAHMDIEGIAVLVNDGGWHRPHGSGTFFQAPMPSHHGGPFIGLEGTQSLSTEAKDFLGLLGPLDLRGWGEVAHLPVEGWPAGEIISAMCDTPGLGALVPIDIKGMVTGRNPSGLYW